LADAVFGYDEADLAKALACGILKEVKHDEEDIPK
jgi:ABC-type thiamine transport system substrate-binding protein